jgi:hypothetical protein
MLWQVDSLISYFGTLSLASTYAGMRFIYLVRHPLFNIRSLLSWCADDVDDCQPSMTALRDAHSNNTLYMRIFADRTTGGVAGTPIALASTWKEAANVYLRDPSRFAAVMRYEDFMGDATKTAARAYYQAHFSWLMHGEVGPNLVLDMEAIQASVDTLLDNEAINATIYTDQETYQGDYNHSSAATLFSANVTDYIVSLCEVEMAAFGYTREGIVANWSDTQWAAWMADASRQVQDAMAMASDYRR